MVASEGGAAAKPRKVSLGQKRRTSKHGGAEDAGDADTEEAENPGLLLADLVAGTPMVRPVTASPKAKRKRPPRASFAEREQADDDLLGTTFGFEADDDDEGGTGEASGRLMSLVGQLGEAEGGSACSASGRRGMQARPESEFHAGSVGEEVTVEDLLAPLAEAPSFGDVRRQLQVLAKKEAMPEPASEVKRSREERAVQYEHSSKDARKWVPQVQRMRRADQVELGPEPAFVNSTEEIVGTFAATDDFEKELEEATRAAGATEEDLRGARMLPMNPRLRKEEETRQVSRLKALLLREQQSSKRIKKIKSKTYRRIHRKGETKDREVLLERLEHENPELAQALKQEYEKKHAQVRLQRQRNARTKWAQTMQRFAKGDRAAQQEITQQAQRAHDDQKALRRAIKGQDPNQSDDSEAVDLSGSDDEAGGAKGVTRQTLSKAKKLTMDEIRKNVADGDDLPTTGIMGLGFMREAIKRKRETAKKEAEEVLKELEGLGSRLDDSDAEREEGPDTKPQPKSKAAKTFTAEELAKAREQVDVILDRDDNAVECTVSGPLTIKGLKAASAAASGRFAQKRAGVEKPSLVSLAATAAPAPAPAAEKPAAARSDNPWLSMDVAAAATEAKEVPKTTKRKKKTSQGKGPTATQNAEASDLELDAADEDPLSVLNADSEAAKAQRELVRTAFVEGAQEEDFAEEEMERERSKQEKLAKANAGLAGWGHWTGDGVAPPKPRKQKATPETLVDKRPPSVTFYEGTAPQAAKFFSEKVPYGFQNPAQFDQQLRMPTGPEWNALPSHLQRIKPKIFMKVGAIVPPLQYVKHLPEESRAGVIDTWAACKQPKRLKARI